MSKRGTYDKTTKRDILDAALTVWPEITYRSVAAAANVAHGTVQYHFPDDLTAAVAAHALDVDNVPVVCHMLVSGNALVAEMSDVDRAGYFNRI